MKFRMSSHIKLLFTLRSSLFIMARKFDILKIIDNKRKILKLGSIICDFCFVENML